MITKIRGVGGEARREAEQGWGHQRSSCPRPCCRSSLHKRCLGYSEPHLSQSLSLSGRPAVKTEPERFFCGAWCVWGGGCFVSGSNLPKAKNSGGRKCALKSPFPLPSFVNMKCVIYRNSQMTLGWQEQQDFPGPLWRPSECGQQRTQRAVAYAAEAVKEHLGRQMGLMRALGRGLCLELRATDCLDPSCPGNGPLRQDLEAGIIFRK